MFIQVSHPNQNFLFLDVTFEHIVITFYLSLPNSYFTDRNLNTSYGTSFSLLARSYPADFNIGLPFLTNRLATKFGCSYHGCFEWSRMTVVQQQQQQQETECSRGFFVFSKTASSNVTAFWLEFYHVEDGGCMEDVCPLKDVNL